MKKVIVIGCPGSGKSMFSRRLHELTGMPLTHLDNLYWNADRTQVPKEEFLSRLHAVMSAGAWIIDGNYSSTMELRMSACDTVFFLDYPTEVCIQGINERRGKPRPDMPWYESGEIDADFVSFVENYRRDSRPRVLEMLMQYPEKSIYVFANRREAQRYLDRFGE